MADRQGVGVFCLEGEWEDEIETKRSVLPILEVLEGQDLIRFAHRNAHTREELEHHIRKWGEKGNDFDFVYLAFHGSRQGLWLSEGQEPVSLEDLASLIGDVGRGAVIHFGTCSVVRRADSDLQAFLDETGARAICGYTRNVDWVDSAAFDLALLYNFATYKHVGRAFNRMVTGPYAGLAKELGFERYPRPS